MESTNKKYGTFEDLEVYSAARELRKRMYAVAKSLPDFEKFALALQIRKAAVSLTNNIAEGHGRYHYIDNVRFVLISRGSLEELVDDLNICQDETYLPSDAVATLRQDAFSLLRQINGYIRYLRQSKSGANLAIHDSSASYEVNEALALLDDEAPISTPPSPITHY